MDLIGLGAAERDAARAMIKAEMDNTTNTAAQRIDELLAELRRAGQHPDDELLDAIRALGMEAVPALIALVSDPAAYQMSEDEEDVSYWAPYPAVEILGELHPPEALEPLLTLVTWDDYDYLEGITPEAVAQYGLVALDPLTAILADQQRSAWTRLRAMRAMERMAEVYPELRDEIVARLTTQLDADEPDNKDLRILRGGLADSLVQLEATESIPSLIRAFETTPIEPFMVSWSDVRERLGVPLGFAPHLDATAPDRRSYLHSLFGSRVREPAVPPAPATVAAPGRTGDKTYRRETAKAGRNDPCPCGSGKKYKKCHGK